MSAAAPAGTHDLARHAAELERQGQLAEACEAYAQLFRESWRAGDAALLADACRREGWIRGRLGRMEEAEELIELSQQVAACCGLQRAGARAMNALATFRHLQGDVDGAQPLYERALELARTHNDGELIGSIIQNLGVIANIRGSLSEARCLYLESIGAAVRSGSRAGAMMAYNNLGMVCADLHEWMEAEIYFGRGIEIAGQLGDAAMDLRLRVNRVEPLIHYGDFPQATRALDRAEQLAIELDDRQAVAEIHRFRGVVARLTGHPEDAERCLNEAVAVAEAADLALERGEALEEIARLRWEQGRGGAARATLREARRCYQEVGAANDLRRLDALQASWEAAPVPA